MQLGVLNIEKRCRWTKEKLNTQNEGENGVFVQCYKHLAFEAPLGAELHCL